jgi:hypothetical protein
MYAKIAKPKTYPTILKYRAYFQAFPPVALRAAKELALSPSLAHAETSNPFPRS